MLIRDVKLFTQGITDKFFKQLTHNGKEGDRSVVARVIDESPDLGTGTIREDFQLSGKVCVEIDMLKIAVIIGIIEHAVSFSVRADTFSRPIALLTSIEQIRW